MSNDRIWNIRAVCNRNRNTILLSLRKALTDQEKNKQERKKESVHISDYGAKIGRLVYLEIVYKSKMDL